MVSTAYELATAYDIARKELVFCDINDTIPAIAKHLRSKNVGSMIVRKGDGYAGIVTEDNVLDAIANCVDVLNARVGDIKLEPLETVHKDASLTEVENLFDTHGMSRIGVVDDDGRIIAVAKKKNLDLLDRFTFVERARR